MDNYNVLKLPDFSQGERLVKIHDFSNEDVHTSGILSSDVILFRHDFYERDIFSFKIYANGNSNENKGYVSLLVEISDLPILLSVLPFLEFSFVRSVTDISGNHRFSQSLKISPCSYLEEGLKNISYGFDKFLKRQTLLSEQSDLLPNDTLTVYFSWYSPQPVSYNCAVDILRDMGYRQMSFNLAGESTMENEGKLFFRSYLFEILSKHSEFFQRMLKTPMKEKLAGCMEVSSKDVYYLKCIGLILMKMCYLSLDISDVCGIYKTAHRYGIHIALDKCREFMKSILSHENVPEISDIAEMYDDSYLKETIERFLQTENEGETEAGSESFNLFSDEERKERLAKARYVLYMDKQFYEMHKHEDEHLDFDFYK